MNKTNLKIIFFSVIVAVLIDLFFSRNLAAYISTLPVMKRLNMLNPQAPVVINRREEIRISEDSNGFSEALKQSSRTSLLVQKEEGGVKILGTAINLTTDGWYVTVKSVFDKAQTLEVFRISSENPKPQKILKKLRDPGSDLVFFFCGNNGDPAAVFGQVSDLVLGQKLIFFQPGVTEDGAVYFEDKVGKIALDSYEYSGLPVDRLVDFFSLNPREAGQIVLGKDSKIFGITTGSGFLLSEDIAGLVPYLNTSEGKIPRASAGFLFKKINKPEAGILNIQEGIYITQVLKNSPAAQAGLKAKDRIIMILGNEFSDSYELNRFMQKLRPDNILKIKIQRDKREIDIEFKLGNLSSL